MSHSEHNTIKSKNKKSRKDFKLFIKIPCITYLKIYII